MAAATTLWDGAWDSYIPGDTLTIDPRLELHTRSADVDPFLFEILKHNLWQINDEHGVTILKVSGSPIANTAEDFATTILTEDAEFVFFGPRNQLQSGTMDLQVKWILENRSGRPGIHPGDMFIGNDPWIGATHQQDVALLAPVFHGDELFCWVGNALHQYDIGGSTPGGFCPDATDTFMEPIAIPPLKIVAGGELKNDVEDVYLRHSRMPQLLALDLRAQVAGNKVAAGRVRELLERYGPEVVKGVMRKIIGDAERAFASRIEQLPDQIVRGRSYLEVALPGDRGIYPVQLQLEKHGSRLIFSMDGTAPQVGALSIGFSGWRSGILSSVNPVLCHDLLYAAGGPLRRIDFCPTAGTIFCATRPAAASMGQGACLLAGALATGALARLLCTDETLAREAFAPGGVSTFPIDSLIGLNQWGQPYATVMLDPMLGGTGAFTFRDGIDTGGCWWDPRSTAPNVEESEHYFPILYLYRREWENSGGAGRFRGGNSGRLAFVAHGTEQIEHSTAAPGTVVPTSEGALGGMPAAPSRLRFVKNTDVRAQFARQVMPEDLGDLDGEPVFVGSKQRGIVQRDADVMELAWCAGGGLGDPFDRAPEAVLRDVLRGAVTSGWAQDVYGVVVRDGALDAEATDARRAALRDRRRDGRKPPVLDGGHVRRPGGPDRPTPEDGATPVARVWDVLEYVRGANGRVDARCQRCGTALSTADDPSYKAGAAVTARPIAEAVPYAQDPAREVDDELVLREFSCPGCARLVATEIARPGDEVLVDIEIRGGEPRP